MSSRHDEEDSRLEQRAKRLFDASVEYLDAPTRARLTRARARALERARTPTAAAGLLGARGWAAAGAAAAVTAAVALLVWQGTPSRPGGVDVAALDDLEILLGEDELEMLEELEFYAWLEEQPELAAPAPADDGVG